MNYCKQCFEETWKKVEVEYRMFDIDGYNLEELPICPNNKEHNEEFIWTDSKTMETFSYYHLCKDDIITDKEINESDK